MMKYLLVLSICYVGSDPQFSLFSGVNPLALPHHPQPPKPASHPTLHLHVPPGTCKPTCTLLDLLVFNPEFSMFVTAVKVAGLVDLLLSPGPATVFAPPNSAWQGLPPEKLQVNNIFSQRLSSTSLTPNYRLRLVVFFFF